MMGTVIDLTEALWRRIAALELEVAERRQILSRAPRRSWQYESYANELIEAERRLSIAEGMPETSELDAALSSSGPVSIRLARDARRRR